MENKKNPTPGRSNNKEPEPNSSPSAGQHQQDIQDEKFKRKHGNRPKGRDDIDPEEIPNGNPEEYHDGPPVEEKSPRVTNSI